MLVDGIRVIAPGRYPEDEWSEAEVLGGFIWLWNQHAYYRQGSVESAVEVLMPIINSRNFCFFVRNQQPLGYVNWAYLSEQDEQAYAHKAKPYTYFTDRQYDAGTPVRLWMLSWFFPVGGSQIAKRLLRRHVLKNERVHFLYHKSAPGTVTTKFFTGLSGDA
ncbi:toxin-activating lysine-acyltransferase [Diaphorobacter aerolatus]|uniref:RTX toxin-activating lysine-acyltransferase n=1 Tax=Diaphorobacter aerolatus TaxID=1288495 RepID=A0A7H0GP27_9BURK|nr:toxin-activating lysine-acyltransferase [Diaphorobacter aerolatus]QNP50043.1 toxin-activating lysine-acyltransferase [Diaphorobacter aerolatus]